MTGTAHQGCQTAQPRARADTISGIKHRLTAVMSAQPQCLSCSHFPGHNANKGSLFLLQCWYISKAIPRAVILMVQAEFSSIFLLPFSGWQQLSNSCGTRCPVLCPVPVLCCSRAVFALMDGIKSLVHQRKTLSQTSATYPSSALQEIRAGHLLFEEQDLPSSESIPIPHSMSSNGCSRAQEGRPGKTGSKEEEQAGLPILVIYGKERVEANSHRGDVLVRGATSQVWFAGSGCLG